MMHIRFMYPLVFWLGVPATLAIFACAALYSISVLEGLRRFYAPSGMFLLDKCSPRNRTQAISVWAHWALAASLLVCAAAMPNCNFAPELARKGALQVEFVVQVNNAMGDESDRRFHPEGDPGLMFQWGTRLDMVKRFIDSDFLPQLAGNKTGITTVEGAGYNMWDLTDDNQGPASAFRVMLDNFTQVGSAPGEGANYASGFATALKEFDLISSIDKQDGDSTSKVRFIVLFADGNDTSDPAALKSEEAELSKRNIHLLIVGMGESTNVSVPRYDPETHQRTGSFDGLTQYQPATLQAIQSAVPGADLIYAPPGTMHISYNFPQKAGGLYAVPHSSNLYSWLVLAALAVLVSLALTGGRLPFFRRAWPVIAGLRLPKDHDVSPANSGISSGRRMFGFLSMPARRISSTRQFTGHNS
jgi:hypothetical protein